ncbi:dehydrogenase/reductase SDR family member 1-like [Mizuhopecten yessoensis]|uniref:Dehydrogenase/reductase SDR family member 1 n=1 Tax=Mizuhopecten yessoensis TaxID=6573 RepID=A0A210PN43_MIZYE|nr:dehydrogenase/reductase SDR family member 1-like [Mizuhopecten yessoensis]OWF37925.1 Dehydrogenase/reductase SDR family member 1 [Mizuhopecten yessoensis]
MSLKGKVCVVTGASRGIGKGIALQLGKAGAIVYITGRTLTSSGDVTGSLTDTAREVEERGGRCIPVQCDHSNDDDIVELFDTIKKQQNGQLDLLVNNAYAAVKMISENKGKSFWEQPMSMWDTVNIVGLRNHYMCAIHAARLMVPRRSGLIVNVSSGGGLKYLFNIPYGVGKEACDRMAADCAVELRRHNVAFVSLWPGAVRTEFTNQLSQSADSAKTKKSGINFAEGETTEYAGKAVVNLLSDKNLMSKKSGKIHLTSDLAYEYGFTDIDGRQPPSIRQLSFLLGQNPKTAWIAKWTPGFLYIPRWLLAQAGNKF